MGGGTGLVGEVGVAREGDVRLAQGDEEVKRRGGGLPEGLGVELYEVEDWRWWLARFLHLVRLQCGVLHWWW